MIGMVSLSVVLLNGVAYILGRTRDYRLIDIVFIAQIYAKQISIKPHSKIIAAMNFAQLLHLKPKHTSKIS